MTMTIEQRTVATSRVRRLTDPLGAAGFRSARPRIAAEARARRMIFAVILALYLAITGILFAHQASSTPAEPGANQATTLRTGEERLAPESRQPHTRTRPS